MRTTRAPKTHYLTQALLGAVLVLGACGGGDGDSGSKDGGVTGPGNRSCNEWCLDATELCSEAHDLEGCLSFCEPIGNELPEPYYECLVQNASNCSEFLRCSQNLISTGVDAGSGPTGTCTEFCSQTFAACPTEDQNEIACIADCDPLSEGSRMRLFACLEQYSDNCLELIPCLAAAI
ncbi:MAG: hypothetical protein JKY56_12380 [Kofleriaceae bacterium]|nr:hypothetical protein [Kofleriaceae bacterium]